MNLNLININKELESLLINNVQSNKVRVIFKATSKNKIIEASSILKADSFSTSVTHSFFASTLVAEIEFNEMLNFDEYQYLIGKLSLLSSIYYLNMITCGFFD